MYVAEPGRSGIDRSDLVVDESGSYFQHDYDLRGLTFDEVGQGKRLGRDCVWVGEGGGSVLLDSVLGQPENWSLETGVRLLALQMFADSTLCMLMRVRMAFNSCQG
jgi:hypothetical protein